MSELKVITNSACVISLTQMGKLELLHELFGTVTIPASVEAECRLQPANWMLVKNPSSPQLAMSLRSRLGNGESDAIALAVELTADRIILDDRRARSAAKSLGLNVIGTVAVLVAARRQGLIPNLSDALEELVETGFFVATDIIESALRAVGELDAQ